MDDLQSENPKPLKTRRPNSSTKPSRRLNSLTADDLAKIVAAVKPPVAPKESKAEEASRLRIAESQHRHRNKVEWFALLIGGIICLACTIVLFTPASDDIKSKSFTAIISLATAGLGFLAGKQSGKS